MAIKRSTRKGFYRVYQCIQPLQKSFSVRERMRLDLALSRSTCSITRSSEVWAEME